MITATASRDRFDADKAQTLENRSRLDRNANLLYWYAQLYAAVFDKVDPDAKILEVGSGASPLKRFLPQVITSDVLPLDHVDHVFDCHEIAHYPGIADASVDIVTMTNVLHHLRDPVEFLRQATAKLKPGGMVVAVEPYFSLVSYPVYRFLHHEPVDFSVERPGLDVIEGPLSSSNQAVPHMLLVSRPEWRKRLASHYEIDNIRLEYFSSLSYPATGGISRVFPIPGVLYRALFRVDGAFARLLPRVFASFFVARLVARRPS